MPRIRHFNRVTGVAAVSTVLFAMITILSGVGQAASPLKLAQATPKDSSTPAAPRATRVLMFFDYDKSTVVPSAQELVDKIVELFKSTGAREVRIIAHTDAAEVNADALSLRRAVALRTALIAKGVPAGTIALVAAGATLPLVPTPKGTKEPQNRRVEVSVIP